MYQPLNVLRKLSLVVTLLSACAAAHAQAGVCKDPWITQAFHQMYQRAPIGSGTTGECDITRYGNGHWTSYQDLMTKIAIHGTGTHAMPASAGTQPTITTAAPTGVAGNVSRPVTPVRQPSAVVTNQNGNGLISDAGGNAVNRNTNGIISQDGNGIISQDGNGMRAVQSVDKPRAPAGKYLVIPGGNLVDANGNVVRKAGSYTLVIRNGSYAVGAGAGARMPVAGNVVAP